LFVRRPTGGKRLQLCPNHLDHALRWPHRLPTCNPSMATFTRIPHFKSVLQKGAAGTNRSCESCHGPESARQWNKTWQVPDVAFSEATRSACWTPECAAIAKRFARQYVALLRTPKTAWLHEIAIGFTTQPRRGGTRKNAATLCYDCIRIPRAFSMPL